MVADNAYRWPKLGTRQANERSWLAKLQLLEEQRKAESPVQDPEACWMAASSHQG